VTILAHEWGHLVQGNLGLLKGQYYTVQTELQADCFAGAWAAHAGEEGLLEEGDLEEGANALFRALWGCSVWCSRTLRKRLSRS
jgi:predicted metalloprotease